MPSPPPRRRAEKPPSRFSRARRRAAAPKAARVAPAAAKATPVAPAAPKAAPVAPAAPLEPKAAPVENAAPTAAPAAPAAPKATPAAPKASRAVERTGGRPPRLRLAAGLLVLAAGVAALVAAMADLGPGWLCEAGSVAVVTVYTWALAARTGGRPVVFGTLALVLGVGVVLADEPVLRTGAAVMTCVVSAVLAVMATVPAVRFAQAAREAVLAVLVAAVGALATVGFEPTTTLARFEYATLALAVVGAFGVVHRLGAGLHGLGRRGVVTVLVGAVVLGLTLAYAELLRRYGTPGLVAALLDGVVWSREHLGAFPRPIESVLGIPAIAWGCHMRARRRQGWWVCAFGVAATAPVAQALLNPMVSLAESGLSVLYGVLVGLLIGFVVIRVDLRVTGPRGRRARRAEEAAALRPEPRRTAALQ